MCYPEIADICSKRYNIVVGNNGKFVAETIFEELKIKNFYSYLECGVYRGTTFFPVYHLCELFLKDFKLFALDTFSGFPKEVTLNENDEFRTFKMLYEKGEISLDHYIKAQKRCEQLPNQEHLRNTYFKDYAVDFSVNCRGKKEIQIVRTSFSNLENSFSNDNVKYDLVFLDCDLYLSYRDCLNFFQDKTDLFVFDEYYSLKYPGARIACDSFVKNNSEWTFFNKIEADPYFERWGIRRQGIGR